MKICVFGAGAIGGYLAVELALAGFDVCVVARGAHLQAIREGGLRLRIEGKEKVARIPASDDPREFGPQDYVICALKAQQAYECAALFPPLLGNHTAFITAMNGIPWWYFHKNGGPLEGRSLEAVDPGARQWKLIGPERAIGCVVDPACETVGPGIIEHHHLNRFTLGEPDGSRSERVTALAAAMVSAGFEAPVREGIRWNIWLKLWGNVCFNPIAALTYARLDRITSEPKLRAVCVAAMLEGEGRLPCARRRDSRRHDGAAPGGGTCGDGAQDVHAAGSRARSVHGDRCAGDNRPGIRPHDRHADPSALPA